ncbi:CCC motif membrane protein [Flavobacterium silvaticum]|uniref:DUF4190 domain-containing protein n=1 Tax=Flavobacterium silvaticum TaxID=1852020 RepID=A0A972JHM4_9FLAO|nr:CCC motif membrane protein [Flavobacterium silvaticum]NMH27283.1 DUF4190 domain-containing protein [Flavobacterium silvaticum]
MEKQKLPNATATLVLGILSILGSCCCGSGIILGIIGLVLGQKDRATYMADPEVYGNFSTSNTGKILSIVGIILSAAAIIYCIIIFSSDEFMTEFRREMERQGR